MAFEAIRQRVADALIRGMSPRNHQEGASAYDRRGSPFVSTWSQPPQRNTYEWLETYGRSPRLGVVSKIAENLSFAPGKLIEKNESGVDQDVPENHPFWAFWNQPNPMPQFTREALWQLHQVYLLLVGEAYMVIEKDWFGYPAELWPLPPHWVTMTPTAGNRKRIKRA